MDVQSPAHDPSTMPEAEAQRPLTEPAGRDSMRLVAATISLVVGTSLLGVKYFAYQLTGSTAILSDAMESIVNVVAAMFALGSLVFAGRPADRSHPYGHGKIEFVSATFEGGLIAFAALLIIYQAVLTIWQGAMIKEVDTGLAITAAAGGVNAALGLFLVGVGRRHQSITLVADGQHVLSDFWTTAGVLVGLGLVRLTDLAWIDPAVAALVGLNLAYTGFRLVKHAAGGLLDAEDPALLQGVTEAINATEADGIICVHHLKAIRLGRFSHIDAHIVVPEFWSVESAHSRILAFEQQLIAAAGVEGEVAFHVDPCHRLYCARCDLKDCPIRATDFRARPPLTLDIAVAGPPHAH